MSGTFVRLPPEVRQIIWNMVLGEHGDAPTMVPYCTARPYMLEEEDDDYDDYAEEEDEYMVTYMGEGPPEDGSEARREYMRQHGLEAEAPGPAVDSDDEMDEDDDIEDYDDDEDVDVEFEPGNPYAQERAWDDDSLIPVYLPPLLLVNREARAITLAWLARHNVQLTRTKIAKGEINTGFPPTPDGTLPPYVRRYDPARDHLYVDRVYWRRFCSRLRMSHVLGGGNAEGVFTEAELEPEQLEQLAALQQPPHDIGAEIRNLALPAFTVYQSTEAVADALRFLPRVESMACLWGDLPTRDWRPDLIYETVRDGEGREKKKVWQLLTPRWDHVEFSETVSEEEMERRRRDTERIKAEREEAQRNKGKGVKQDDDYDDDDDDDDDDFDFDDFDDEEEGSGPLVTICIRDPEDGESVFWERGYLGTWMQEVYNALIMCELPDHVRDPYHGSFTLPIVACKAVCPTAAVAAAAAAAVAEKAAAGRP